LGKKGRYTWEKLSEYELQPQEEREKGEIFQGRSKRKTRAFATRKKGGFMRKEIGQIFVEGG